MRDVFLRKIPLGVRDGTSPALPAQMEDPLVAAAAKLKGQILFFFYEFSVHKNIYIGKKLICGLGMYRAFGIQKITLIGVAGVAPDILLWKLLFDLAQKHQKRALVVRLHGLAAQQGQSLDIVMLQRSQDIPDDPFGERLAGLKVPGLRLKAASAVMGAARYKKYCPDSGAVGDVVVFYGGIVHF